MTVGVPSPAQARCSFGPPTSMREPGGEITRPPYSSRRIVAGFLTITSRLATTPTVATNTVVTMTPMILIAGWKCHFWPGPESTAAEV